MNHHHIHKTGCYGNNNFLQRNHSLFGTLVQALQAHYRPIVDGHMPQVYVENNGDVSMRANRSRNNGEDPRMLIPNQLPPGTRSAREK